MRFYNKYYNIDMHMKIDSCTKTFVEPERPLATGVVMIVVVVSLLGLMQ